MPTTTDMRPLRDQLRAITRSLHDQVEALWAPAQGFAKRADYMDFLQSLLRVHISLGLPAALARGGSEETSQENARISALCRDLQRARPMQTAATGAAMDHNYAWGVGYVLNGSSLGAAVLLKSGGVQADWPVQYLKLGQSYAQRGDVRRFFDQLNAAGLAPQAVQAGALDTFRALARDTEIHA